jgi:hypothetical protein
MVSHSEAVHVEFSGPIEPEEARRLLARMPGLCLSDEPQAAVYPLPLTAAGRDEVFVGRLRRDASHPNSLAMWLSSDNLWRCGFRLTTCARAPRSTRSKLPKRSSSETWSKGGLQWLTSGG